MLTSDVASQAHFCWEKGDLLEAGKMLFESLPNETHPKWAANILTLVIERTGTKSDEIVRIIDIADRPNAWNTAHEAFDDLRMATLKLEKVKNRNSDQALLLSQLLLAELVAKVTYNSTQPDDEFDEDSGWWIATCLKDILNQLEDERFSAIMWSAISLNETPPAGAKLQP